MLLFEIPVDNKLIIELTINGQRYEFPSKVIKKGKQDIYAEPIRINGKVLSFNTSENIFVSLIMVRDGKSPMVWKGVAINSAYEKEGTLYRITASGEGFEVNRRGAFRLFVGISGVAQMGINKKAVDVIVKDVSESGFSFVSTEDIDNVINMPVRMVFNDFNQTYSLMGIIVRKVIIAEAKILYGCQLSVNNTNLEHYINQKQRQMLSMNRGFLMTFCNEDTGLLFTLCFKDCLTSFTLCLHLLFHCVLNFTRRNNVFKLYSVYLNAPRVGRFVEDNSDFCINGITRCKS